MKLVSHDPSDFCVLSRGVPQGLLACGGQVFIAVPHLGCHHEVHQVLDWPPTYRECELGLDNHETV